MMKTSLRYSVLLPVLFFFLLISCQIWPSDEVETIGSEDITTLPMNRIPLDDLQAFKETGDNWSIVGEVHSDYKTRQSLEVIEGTGVLVAQVTDNDSPDIFTKMEHGDIELKLEFLKPLGTNSGIYFQGRYEISILDSWRVENLRHLHLGGIYQRWDESLPVGEQGDGGIPPTVNAALAPGLWNEYHIIFRAPRFDELGNKTENARFEKVYLNGVLVQDNQEVGGPTRAPSFVEEAPLGPLQFQDMGQVAFRNIEYKTYSQTDSITLGEMAYTVYKYDGQETPTDFENLEVIAEGVTDHFDVSELSPINSHYATTFSGEFEVPTTGEYLFETRMSNGGNLYINGELLVENTGEFESRHLGNTIHLTKGTHQIDITHFQVIWSTQLSIDYEGPNIEKRPLIWQPSTGGEGSTQPPVTVEVNSDYPELIGGFFNYGGEKRTHVLSVGHSEGIHYSYDLGRASLLSFWRDPFADVTQMWRGRGAEQLLRPMNAAVESGAGIPLINLNTSEGFENEWDSSSEGVTQYRLNEQGQPIFKSTYDNIQVEDHIRPGSENYYFVRTLTYRSDQPQRGIVGRLAQGDRIELLSNGLYRINGRYYIDIINTDGQDPEIAEENGIQALVIPILRDTDHSEIQYQMIW